MDTLQSRGRYTFKKNEAMTALKVSEIAFRRAASRLMKKKRLVSPRRGFFVIVPTEYLATGAPPASWFVHDLMKFHGQPYYVGLLSAAAIHGAAHQQPQETQVVTTKPLRPVEVGRSRIRFFMKRRLEKTAITQVNSHTGYLTVSTPEATAIDLVRYLGSVGHLGNVATVLTELSEKMKAADLLKAAQADVELSAVQRIGYLLDHLGYKNLTAKIYDWCAKQNPTFIPLSPGVESRGHHREEKWHIIENEEVESDI